MDTEIKPTQSTYLTPVALSARYGGSPTVACLAAWRYKGLGPRFLKAGKAVLYALVDVEEWESKRMGGGSAGVENNPGSA